jgi:hypothetical protein
MDWREADARGRTTEAGLRNGVFNQGSTAHACGVSATVPDAPAGRYPAFFPVLPLRKKGEIAKRTQIEKCINCYLSDTNAKNLSFWPKKRTQFYSPAYHKISHGGAVETKQPAAAVKIKPKSNGIQPKNE